MKLSWASTSRSHQGKVRKLNEDAVFMHPAGMLWAVADGMGGYEAGDTASAIVVEELAGIESSDEIAELTRRCQQHLHLANARIQKYSMEKCSGRNVGSTVVCFLSTESGSSCVWAGDSRLYRLRGSELAQLSTDHSEVAQLVALGHLTEEEARVHPKANVITRTIGVGGDQGTETISVDVQSADTLLLCSDGLYNELEDSSILECLLLGDIETAADELMSRCLLTPAKDNISIVLLRSEIR
ncbi:MAG: serine/threonine phosphoprotein phosphatase Stp1 [Pseudohongiella sp.]|nr:MAG: serine/threonine phosphoprotein phosphatase Stp1 [Pseudohongiella sp.]